MTPLAYLPIHLVYDIAKKPYYYPQRALWHLLQFISKAYTLFLFSTASFALLGSLPFGPAKIREWDPNCDKDNSVWRMAHSIRNPYTFIYIIIYLLTRFLQFFAWSLFKRFQDSSIHWSTPFKREQKKKLSSCAKSEEIEEAISFIQEYLRLS